MNDDRLDELDEAQRALALKLRTSLRDSERVDSVTAAKLAQARVPWQQSGPRSRSTWVWASGGLTAAAIVAALLVQLGGARWSTDPVETNVADTIEVLTDDMDAEFYEDLDLYRWLADDGRA